MSTTFAHHSRRRNSLRAAALLLAALSWPRELPSRRPGLGPRLLYLLAATTTQHSDDSYPASLYRVNSKNKLELAREVVSQTEGVRFVYGSADLIFLLYPHNSDTAAAIIHADDPVRTDNVVFRSKGTNTASSATTLAAPPSSAPVLLTPWITNLIDPTRLPEHFDVTVARISSAPASPRVVFNNWSDYRYMRSEGAEGGPSYVADLVGSAEDGRLAINYFGHPVVVDDLPRSLRTASRKVVPIIVAVNAQFLVVCRQRSQEEMRSSDFGDTTELYVHDKARGAWNMIQAEGNSSTLRLFGSWLGAIVGNWSINHEQPNPGRENERPEEGKTTRLPPVQTLYRSFKGHNILLPGILTLQNLADGRKIRLETGQEDSEILRVEGDVVLYRVNDTIYQARIDGSQLKDTTVVVKDEDVPEIHWAFWSK